MGGARAILDKKSIEIFKIFDDYWLQKKKLDRGVGGCCELYPKLFGCLEFF